ncbi:MAG: hypothetical protein FJ398_24160, partial [Verrucomicrobia bacterium]|nr:hypothetical protein [Verrucomicrobiota bacterium]
MKRTRALLMTIRLCRSRGAPPARFFRALLSPVVMALSLFASGCGTPLAAVNNTSQASSAETTEKSRSRQGPGTKVQGWLSSEDGTARLTPLPDLQFQAGPAPGREVIQIDDTTTYQPVLGIGSSFEHSTCYNLSLLPAARREKVIESLVHPEHGIGMNLMRLCIGTSDFAPGPF